MNNPNRKTTIISKVFTRKNVIITTVTALLISSLATIWVGYNRITERDKQIDSLSSKVTEFSKKLDEAEVTNLELTKNSKEQGEKINSLNEQIISLNEDLIVQKNTAEKLASDNKALKNENAELTKKYRELVTP